MQPAQLAIELLVLFAMWAAMMVTMMAPSAVPLVLTFARANRKNGASRVAGSAGILLVGYLLAWVGSSVPAALLQWALHSAGLLSHMMESSNAAFDGLLLAAAGAFQLTPLKHACLLRCRSPLSFLMADWREGPWGALRMGLKHGAYCVGCCWLLMLLMFIAGVMNLLWAAAIAVLVLLEKIAPRGDLLARVAGAVLIAAGVVHLAA
jgi:predicted metal-binding membrane protein